MKKFLNWAALPLAMALPLAAQQSEPLTKQQGDQIIKELQQVIQLLQQQNTLILQQNTKAAPQPQAEPPAARAKLNLEGYQMLGVKSAPVTIVEFTDYQCPFCQRFHVASFPELKKNYIDTGKVRFYSRDLPLDFHPNAMRAAGAARCAIEQGKYWQLRNVMGENPDKLDLDHLVAFATELKMDPAAFKTCVTSDKYKAAIQADVMDAMKIGATGTPTFVVGKSTAEGVDGEVVIGAQPYQVFDEKLKELSK